jgi:hypothetical protein
MAVNETRSLNGDLQQGMNDGVLKSLTPDRGGEVEDSRPRERAENLQRQYGFADIRKFHPSGCGCGYC